MAIDHVKLVAALRDTAAKATETITEKRPSHQVYGVMQEQDYKLDAYSKDWIAGRLLGMADTIEALISGDTNDRT